MTYKSEWLVRDLTDYSLLPNGLVFVQNTYSSFLRDTTEYNFIIGSNYCLCYLHIKKEKETEEVVSLTYPCNAI